MKTTRKTIQELFDASGMNLSATVADRLETYFEELQRWNRRVNLTGIKQAREQVLKHLGDTLTLMPLVPAYGNSILDIGTGAGVPGLLLAILCPETDITLVDAARKRVSFLIHVSALMGLENVRSIHARAGDNMQALLAGEKFDMAVSQATVTACQLAAWAFPVLSENGAAVSMKGPKFSDELDASARDFRKLGINIKVITCRVPLTFQERNLVIMKKRFHRPQ